MKKSYFYFIYFISFILIWEMIVRAFNISYSVLPPPSAILIEVVTNFDMILYHSKYTIFEALLGLFFAIIFGIFIAILIDYNNLIKKILDPIITISQTIPSIVLAPIFIIWFGFGILGKVIFITILCSFPIIISTYQGMQEVSQDHITMFKLMGANNFQIYHKLKLPYAKKSFFSGLRIATTYSITAAIIAEYMGAEAGLGLYLSRALSSFNIPLVFGIIGIISAITLILLFIVNKIEKKTLFYEEKL